MVALDELVLHGWDIAQATGQDYAPNPDEIEACLGFVMPTTGEDPTARDGIFGPAVPMPIDASPMDRLLGLSGRDPQWS